MKDSDIADEILRRLIEARAVGPRELARAILKLGKERGLKKLAGNKPPGPPPKAERELARKAFKSFGGLPGNERLTHEKFAASAGVSPQHLHNVLKAHGAEAQSEYVAPISKRLTQKLSDREPSSRKNSIEHRRKAQRRQLVIGFAKDKKNPKSPAEIEKITGLPLAEILEILGS